MTTNLGSLHRFASRARVVRWVSALRGDLAGAFDSHCGGTLCPSLAYGQGEEFFFEKNTHARLA